MSIWNIFSLHPHRDTGKLVPHHHTSYAGIGMLLLVLGLGMAGITMGASAGILTGSGNIQIAGTVPGPPPATAPEIVTPVSDSHVVASPTAITGNCISGLVVVIERNGSSAGSTLCASDGTFGLSIDLYNGRNDLIATQYDSINQASPPSAVTTIYFDQLSSQNPAVKPPVTKTPTTTTPVPPAPVPHPPLIIETKYSYQDATAGSEVSLAINISGGHTPYAVNIDWGDGQPTLLTQPENGWHTYSHTYKAGANYRVIIRATDATGVTGYFETVMFVSGPSPAATVTPPVTPTLRLLIAWPIYAALLILVVGFWLGERYDANRWRHRLGASRS